MSPDSDENNESVRSSEKLKENLHEYKKVEKIIFTCGKRRNRTSFYKFLVRVD